MFSVGDRVQAMIGSPSYNFLIHRGDQGTVCCAGDTIIGVEWDKDVRGHDCDGFCKQGFEWKVRAEEVCLAEKEADFDIEEDAFMGILKATF